MKPGMTAGDRTRAPIRVEVGAVEVRDGATHITQSFVLPHPRETVWRLISNPQAVARCMPGLILEEPLQGERLEGRLQVKIGPITASFAGEGTLRQSPAEFRQTIVGRGGDRGTGSRVSGSLALVLTPVPRPGGEATRVEATMIYVLSGPLAQISRPGLVRDLVRRIGETFARNLDAQLTAPDTFVPTAAVGGLALVFRVLLDRLSALLARNTDLYTSLAKSPHSCRQI
jgi:carbon-monoxide dehydrogenase small subunit